MEITNTGESIVVDKTTEMPTIPPQPTKLSRTPITPQHRSILYGIVAVGVMVTAFVWGIVFMMTNSDNNADQSKTDQVTACSNIAEPNAATLCVLTIDD